jgi:hypothetical protein
VHAVSHHDAFTAPDEARLFILLHDDDHCPLVSGDMKELWVEAL